MLLVYRGGYYQLPIVSTKYEFTNNTAYYFYEGLGVSPALEDIENELSKYVKYELGSCVNFGVFEEQGIIVEGGEINAQTKIQDGKVLLNVNYPLTITKGESVSVVENFNADILSDIKKFFDLSKQITEEQNKDPNSILESFLIDLALENNINYDLIQDGDNVIYVLIDKKPRSSGFPPEELPTEDNQVYYTFIFAIKYDWNLAE